MDTPLDYFDEFEATGVKVVVARYFYTDSEAYIYAARLREAGINCFVSNSHAIAAVPLGNGGIGLHVRETDLSAALTLIKEVDQQSPAEQDFRDADHAEIEYERSLNQPNKATRFLILFFVILFGGLLVMRAFSRAAGYVDSWWDFF
ncbi:MAG: DUF2007 domain-containing protein [Saprospiraceae bacterium]